MERVCKKATDFAGVPVLPCYMYALTREGRIPPMTQVRKSVYSLLRPRKKCATTVNLLGEFAPFYDDTELYEILRAIGVKKINEISRCTEFEEYLSMAEANFNLILNPECRLAAKNLHQRLGIPGIELTRLYQIDKIHKQYELLGGALGTSIDDRKYYEMAQKAVDDFNAKYPQTTFAIGECLNATSFELALALLRYGHKVSELYATVSAENFIYIKKIAKISPQTRIYTNLSPTMIHYDCGSGIADITIGKDAAYYHPDSVNVAWNEERQPFGYSGLIHLFEALTDAMERRKSQ
jgi:nitrogenase molybdenum-cofactor synthesis protein NifE